MEEIQKNKELFGLLQEVGKHAVKYKHIIRNWFRPLDPAAEGTVPMDKLDQVLSAQSVNVHVTEKDLMRARYRQGELRDPNPSFNYKKFELEVAQVYPLYADLSGINTAEAKRSAEEVLTLLLKEINKTHKTLYEFITSIDRSKKKFLNRGDIKEAVNQYNSLLGITDQEFDEVYLMINPRKEAKIMYYRLEEAMNNLVLPIVQEVASADQISGKVLNGFDRSQEPLGMKVNQRGVVKKRMVTIQAIAEILKEYESTFTENQMWFLINYLEVPLNAYSFVYQDFVKVYLIALEKMQLRDSHSLSLFFASAPVASMKPLAADASGKAAVDGAGNPVSPQVSLKSELLAVKQALKVLTEEDAREAFRNMTPTSVSGVALADFEALLKRLVPQIPEKTRQQLGHCFFDERLGKISRDKFVDVLVKQNPEVLDRLGLLFEKTAWAKPIYEAVFEKLRQSRKTLREVFGSEEASLQKALDALDLSLRLPYPQDKVSKLLLVFVKSPEHPVVQAAELQEVVDEYGERMKPAQADTSLILSDASFRESAPPRKNGRLADLVNAIRAKVKENPSYYLRKFAQVVSDAGEAQRDSVQKVDYAQFRTFLAIVHPDVNKATSKELFASLELDQYERADAEDVMTFFGLRKAHSESSGLGHSSAVQSRAFEQIVRDITAAVFKRKLTLDTVFDFKSGRLRKKDLLKICAAFGMKEVDYKEWPQFLEYLGVKGNPSLVDGGKLKLLIEDFLSRETGVRPADQSSKSEMYLFDLLVAMDDNIQSIIVALDPDGDGLVSLAEFYARTKRITKSQFSQADIEKVFNEIKDSADSNLMTSTLRARLIEVVSKYDNNAFQNHSVVLDQASVDSDASRFFRESKPADLSQRPAAGRERDLRESASTPIIAGGSRVALTAEEAHKREVDMLYAKVRKQIDYKDNGLFDLLREEDKAGSNRLHPEYVLDILRKLGADLSDSEKKLLFEETSKDGELVLYLDFVHRLFPTKQIAKITSTKHLVEELVQQLRITKKTLRQLWLEAKGSATATVVTEPNFKAFLAKRGLLLADETIRQIFKEFDEQKDFQINEEEFFKQFHSLLKVRKGAEVAKIVKEFLVVLKKSSEEAFTPFLSKEKALSFDRFVDAVDSFKVQVNYLEIEVLFDFVDLNQSGSLDVDELKKKLDVPAPVPTKEMLTSKTVRSAMYRFMAKKGISFNDFFEVFDSNPPKTYWTIKDFEVMIKGVGLENMKLKEDVQPVFEAIDIVKDYAISREELAAFYDESTVLLLFPVLLEFKTLFLNEMARLLVPSAFFLRKHDLDSDDGLNKKELKSLMKEISAALATDENVDLMFDELDSTKDGVIMCAELRAWLMNRKILDVVELSDRIRIILTKGHHQSQVAFKNADKDNSGGLDFREFFQLLTQTLLMNVNIIEAEEVFCFAAAENRTKVNLKEFTVLFDNYKPPNPYLHNAAYMAELPDATRKYYFGKYKFMNPQNQKADPGRLHGYDRKRDDELLGHWKKEEMHGAQSAPSLLRSNLDQKTDSLTDDDAKFVAKLGGFVGEALSLEQFFRKHAADETGLMGEAEFEKLCMAVQFKATPEVRHRILANISPRAGSFGYTEFHKYYDLVKLKVGHDAFDPRQEVTKFAKELCNFMIERGYLLEEVVQEHKKAKTAQGLSLLEFTDLVKTIDSTHFTTPDAVQNLFSYLCRGKKVATLEDFAGVLDDYESVKELALQKKDAILKQNLYVGRPHPGAPEQARRGQRGGLLPEQRHLPQRRHRGEPGRVLPGFAANPALGRRLGPSQEPLPKLARESRLPQDARRPEPDRRAARGVLPREEGAAEEADAAGALRRQVPRVLLRKEPGRPRSRRTSSSSSTPSTPPSPAA